MSDMQRQLVESGYTPLDDRVWGRIGFAGIAYSDGDASEDGLLLTLRCAGDVSVFSPELRSACVDWPSFYHLSSERANLLRPFSTEFSATTRVLEIGAGCGAVTRFLGETGAQVLALEGSRRRAIIARERTRDLGNVEVVAERFQEFAPDARFDVITLIGVLEYANVFSDAPQAALDMLDKVRAMLAPGGCLFLAIENRFGLKYLAGAPEDHLGKPMVGVEGGYSRGGVRTYGRAELDALLARAGFGQRAFHVPLPDYKTPVSIIAPAGLQADPQEFDAGTLAAQAVRRDHQLGATTFNLQRAWTGIGENGLMLDLGNSFLVRAVVTGDAEGVEGPLAWHYSTQRSGEFARESRFVRDGSGQLVVRSRALGSVSCAADDVVMRVADEQPYLCGTLFVERFRTVLTKPGWTIDELAEVGADYLNAIRGALVEDGIEITLDDPTQILPDHYIDATPFNLISVPEGRPVYFDREWAVPSPSLGWLTLRSVLFTYAGTTAAPMQAVDGVERVGGLVRAVLERLYPGDRLEWLEAQLLREARFQSVVTGVEQGERLREALDIPLPTDASVDNGSGYDSAALFAQVDRVSQSLHAGVAHVGDRVGSVLEQQDAMSQSLHAVVGHVGDRVGSVLELQDATSQSLHTVVGHVGDRVGSVLEQQDATSQSLHAGVAHVGDRLGSVLEQQDAMSQSLHAVVGHVGDRVGSVLEQQDATSQSLHAGVAHVGDRLGSVLEQQDAMSQSLHAVVGHVGDRVGSVLEQQDATSQSLHAGVAHVGDRVGSVLEQQDAMSQSLHAVMGHVGDRVGSVLEQQDAMSQGLHAIAQGIAADLHVLGSDAALSRHKLDGLLEQLDAVSQSLHAVSGSMQVEIGRVHGDVALANERADELLKQLDAVSQSLHAVMAQLGAGMSAHDRSIQALVQNQQATQAALDAMTADLAQLQRRSFAGTLGRVSGWFRRGRI
ncbi:class I SAM-dependent methyltransferase [Novilysobacter luteus]|nr:methyltransferase [Lysobacter luteus]